MQVVQERIDSGADINKAITSSPFPTSLPVGYTPIMMAAKNCVPETLNKLVAAGADVSVANAMGNTALIETSNFENVKVLLEAGVNVNTMNKIGQTALKNAISSYIEPYEDSTERIELLLKHGADPNLSLPMLDIFNLTRDAPIEKPLTVFHLLIESGARIPDAFIAKISGYTQALPLIEEAVSLGANINGRYFGDTALSQQQHQISKNFCLKLVQKMI